jgi:NAD dependent epimerase/dehydratase family enzyme
MRILRRCHGRPFGLPAALWMMETGAFLLRTETELMIKSRRVVRGRLSAAGFPFRFVAVEDAVREIESRWISSIDRRGDCHARELSGSHLQ